MELEYTDAQKKKRRIAELEEILNNELYENEVDKLCLDIELQFLQGSENSYGEPYACVGTNDVLFDVIYEDGEFSATLYDENGYPQLPYLNGEDLESLVREILEM